MFFMQVAAQAVEDARARQFPIVFDEPFSFQPTTLTQPLNFPLNQPMQSVQPQQTANVGQQVFELGWRALDAPSLTAFQLGGRIMRSPNEGIRILGAALCIVAFLRALNKLDEALDN